MKQREFPVSRTKVVLITGAAQGLGEALAIRLSEEGAKVVVGDMNIEGAKNVAAQLAEAWPRRSMSVITPPASPLCSSPWTPTAVWTTWSPRRRRALGRYRGHDL